MVPLALLAIGCCNSEVSQPGWKGSAGAFKNLSLPELGRGKTSFSGDQTCGLRCIWPTECCSALARNWGIEPGEHMDMPSIYATESKKPIWKGCILYDFNHVALWTQQKNTGNNRRTRGYPEERGRMDITLRILGQWRHFLWYHHGGYT